LAPPLHHSIATPTGQPHHQGDKAQRHSLLAILKPTVTIEEQIDLLKHRLLCERIYGNMWGDNVTCSPKEEIVSLFVPPSWNWDGGALCWA